MDTDLYSKNTTTCKGVKKNRFIMLEMGWEGSPGNFNVLGCFIFLKKI